MISRTNAWLFALLLSGSAATEAQLKIVVMDCGQGNAAFIQSPSGKACIIDAGAGGNGWGTSTFLPFIRDTTNFGKTRLTHLDYTFVSHYHADHIYGMDEVINGLGRDSILSGCYDRGGSYGTAAYTNYTTAAGTKRMTSTLGQLFDLGSGVTLRTVCMNGQVWTGGSITPGSEENNSSMGMLLTYGNFKMIFATDIAGQNNGNYKNQEGLLAPVIGRVNVLLVNHHGAATSTNLNWVTTLNPQTSISSCGGPTNSYSHPRQTVIDTLLMDPKDTKSRDGDTNYIYQTEATTGYGVIPAGRGRAVDKNIWIRVFPNYYVVVGDIPKDTVMFQSLAVELSSFTGQCIPGGVELSWRTESETGCYQWQIERSEQRDDGYNEIGTVPGHGSTSGPQQYSFADNTVTTDGMYYYRLAETDISGVKTYHGPTSVAFNQQGVAAFAAGPVWPNPSHGQSSISYQLPLPGTVSLAIYNVLGQRVKTLAEGRQPAGKFSVRWDGHDGSGAQAAGGIYFYRIQYEDAFHSLGRQSSVKRLVLTR